MRGAFKCALDALGERTVSEEPDVRVGAAGQGVGVGSHRPSRISRTKRPVSRPFGCPAVRSLMLAAQQAAGTREDILEQRGSNHGRREAVTRHLRRGMPREEGRPQLRQILRDRAPDLGMADMSGGKLGVDGSSSGEGSVKLQHGARGDDPRVPPRHARHRRVDHGHRGHRHGDVPVPGTDGHRDWASRKAHSRPEHRPRGHEVRRGIGHDVRTGTPRALPVPIRTGFWGRRHAARYPKVRQHSEVTFGRNLLEMKSRSSR